MMKTNIQGLKQLIEIKDFDSVRSKALAHISAKQIVVYEDWVKWKERSPDFGLEQEQIDSVIAGQERDSDMLEYIYNVILNDKHDS